MPGLFFEFGIPYDDDDLAPYWTCHADSVVSKRHPTNDELWVKGKSTYFLCDSENVAAREVHRDCPVDRTHVTAEYWTKAKCYVRGGTRVSAFVSDLAEVEPMTIISQVLAGPLKQSGLVGFSLVQATIDPQHPSAISKAQVPKGLALFVLNFMGTPCERSLTVRGAPNACPFCGKGPIVCPGCWVRFIGCPHCKEQTWTTRKDHGGANDRRLIVEPPKMNESRILEGAKWDGSDFIYAPMGGFITKRCLDWLLSVHAAPFYALPALVNVEGLSPEQLAKIEAAGEPVVPIR